MTKPYKILVIGCGSIGRRHIRLLKEMGVEVKGVEPDITTRQKILSEVSVPTWETVQEALDFGPYDGAIIATPNHLHQEPAEECIRAGLPVLIEKPICHTLEEAGALELLHRVRPVPLLVGYMLRWHPGLRRLKRTVDDGTLGTIRHISVWCSSYLPSWRPGTDYRTNYAARPETGGGVLLDCSHELDYLLWMFGEPEFVSCITFNSGALGITAEEVADVVVRFRNGVQANVHLSYLDHDYHRGCRVVGDDGTLTMNLYPSQWSVHICPKGGIALPQDWGTDSPDVMYRAELKHFLGVIEGREQPLVTGEDGLRVLRLIEAAKKSNEEGRVIPL